MKNKELLEKLLVGAGCILLVLLVMFVGGKLHSGSGTFDDGVEKLDADTIRLKNSKVDVTFSDVILTGFDETRKLQVCSQEGTVSTQLTARMIEALDFDFLKKTQQVSYAGKGTFVVDLARLDQNSFVQDKNAKTLTILIEHAYLDDVNIDPNEIVIDEVNEGLLARGDIKLTVQDYQTIEKELRERLEQKFNTAENGQKADDIALAMVKETYEPIVKAIDSSYTVDVKFKS